MRIMSFMQGVPLCSSLTHMQQQGRTAMPADGDLRHAHGLTRSRSEWPNSKGTERVHFARPDKVLL